MRQFIGTRLATCAALTALVVTAFAATGIGQSTTLLTHYEGPGTLGHGPQGCFTFTGDDGAFFFPENTGEFIFGDRVYVSGTENPELVLCFPLAGLALEDNTIAALFEGPGTIGWGPQSCLHFMADTGEGFFIKDTAGFFPGSRVYVIAAIEEDSFMCWPRIGTALVNTQVYEFFQGSGVLAWGPQGCIALLAETGDIYMLGDSGGFLPGTAVSVTGYVEEDSELCWPYIGTALRAVTISEARRPEVRQRAALVEQP